LVAEINQATCLDKFQLIRRQSSPLIGETCPGVGSRELLARRPFGWNFIRQHVVLDLVHTVYSKLKSLIFAVRPIFNKSRIIIREFHPVLRIRDPVLFLPPDPGSGISFFRIPDPGSDPYF
jgi:hypothetical protein